MAEAESGGQKNEGASLRRKDAAARDDAGEILELVAGIVAETSLKWEDVLELSPQRLKYVARAIRKRRILDKLAYFDAQSALIDEKFLRLLNSELGDSGRV